MKTNKLAQKDISRVSDVLTKCAQSTKDIEDREELKARVYDILSKELGDTPGLFKAACQVYNSCKSIHYLSNTPDDRKGKSFAILDVGDMVNRLADEKAVMRKAASAPVTSFTKLPTSGTVLKTASEATAPRPANAPKQVNIRKSASEHEIKNLVITELADMDKFLGKLSSDIATTRVRKEASAKLFNREAALLNERDRIDAFSRLSAVYGNKAQTLIDNFNACTPDKSLNKQAYAYRFKGTPTLGSSAIFKKASEAIDSDARLETLENINAVATKNSVAALRCYTKALNKKAGMGLTALLGADAAKDMLGIKDKNDKNLIQEIYNPEYLNEILGHSYGRAFMRLVADPTVAKYPLNEIVNAYNAAVAKLPANTRMTPATLHQALINSQVINALTTGSVPSKADTDTIESLMSAYGKLRVIDGMIGGNERMIGE